MVFEKFQVEQLDLTVRPRFGPQPIAASDSRRKKKRLFRDSAPPLPGPPPCRLRRRRRRRRKAAQRPPPPPPSPTHRAPPAASSHSAAPAAQLFAHPRAQTPTGCFHPDRPPRGSSFLALSLASHPVTLSRMNWRALVGIYVALDLLLCIPRSRRVQFVWFDLGTTILPHE